MKNNKYRSPGGPQYKISLQTPPQQVPNFCAIPSTPRKIQSIYSFLGPKVAPDRQIFTERHREFSERVPTASEMHGTAVKQIYFKYTAAPQYGMRRRLMPHIPLDIIRKMNMRENFNLPMDMLREMELEETRNERSFHSYAIFSKEEIEEAQSLKLKPRNVVPITPNGRCNGDSGDEIYFPIAIQHRMEIYEREEQAYASLDESLIESDDKYEEWLAKPLPGRDPDQQQYLDSLFPKMQDDRNESQLHFQKIQHNVYSNIYIS